MVMTAVALATLAFVGPPSLLLTQPSASPHIRRRGSSVVSLAKKRKAPPPPDPETFAELGVRSPALTEALDAMGCLRPMECQRLTWEPLCETQQDVTLIAEAGSGKTLAYLVPLIEALLRKKGDAMRHQLHVVVPTHDLVVQVLRVARMLCAGTELLLVSAEDTLQARGADLGLGEQCGGAQTKTAQPSRDHEAITLD